MTWNSPYTCSETHGRCRSCKPWHGVRADEGHQYGCWLEGNVIALSDANFSFPLDWQNHMGFFTYALLCKWEWPDNFLSFLDIKKNPTKLFQNTKVKLAFEVQNLLENVYENVWRKSFYKQNSVVLKSKSWSWIKECHVFFLRNMSGFWRHGVLVSLLNNSIILHKKIFGL